MPSTWFNTGTLRLLKNWWMNTGSLQNLKAGWMNTGTLQKTYVAETAYTYSDWPSLYSTNLNSGGSSTTNGDAPTVAMDGNTNWDNNCRSSGVSGGADRQWTWVIRFNNIQISYSGIKIWGYGQNDNWKSSPKSFTIYGSNDGSSWTTLYDTTSFPDSWCGDSWNYGWSCPSNSYSPTGPGAQTVTFTQSGFYTYLKIIWRLNQYGNVVNQDDRYCWANDPNWAYYHDADIIALKEIQFQGVYKPQ